MIRSLQLSDPDTHRGLRSEEHTSELQSRRDLVCRLLLEKKKECPDLLGRVVHENYDAELSHVTVDVSMSLPHFFFIVFVFLSAFDVHVRCFFFFNDTATTEIYTLSLHDALPI